MVSTVGRLGEMFVVTVRFLDLERGVAEFSAEEKADREDDLFLSAERRTPTSAGNRG